MSILTMDNLLNPVTSGFIYRTKITRFLRASEHWRDETLYSKNSLLNGKAIFAVPDINTIKSNMASKNDLKT